MSKRTKSAIAIQNYLENLSGGTALKREIVEQIGIADCTFDRAMKTLRSRGLVEVAGKQGNANLYKIKQ